MSQEKAKIKRKFTGEVVSAKMDKTVVVKVERIVTHPVYKKKIKRSLRLKAHAPTGEYKEGDLVIIEECRPLSREKRWRVIGKVK